MIVLGERCEGDEASDGEAFIKPLYRLDANRETGEQEWKPIQNPTASISPLGRLRLPNHNASLPRFVFGPIKEVPVLKSQMRRWYNFAFTNNPSPVQQQIVPGQSGLATLRNDLTGVGRSLAERMIGDVSVWMSDRERIVLGPLEENPEKLNHWRLPTDSKRIFERFIGQMHYQAVDLEGDHYTIGLPSHSSARGDMVDWRPDNVIVQETLAWMRSQDPTPGQVEILSTMETLTNRSGSSRLNPAVRARFTELTSSTLLAIKEKEEIATLLSARPEFQERQQELVEAAITQAKATRIDEIERAAAQRLVELAAELSDREFRIDELREERQTLGLELEEKWNGLQNLKTQFDERAVQFKRDLQVLTRLADSLSEKIQTTVEQAVAKLVEETAESAVLRFAKELDILKSLGIAEDVSTSKSSSDMAKGSKITALKLFSLPTASSLSSAKPADLLAAVKTAGKHSGILVSAPQRILAAMLDGRTPILRGSAALRLLQAVADGLMNGACLVVPIAATALEPADLLGRFDAASRAFLPAPFGLADLIMSAHQIPHPVLVVFEGVNRAPLESILMPFVELFTNPDSHGLRLAHRGSIGEDDPFAGLADFRWPQNLLLAATVVDGAATLPLGASWAPSCCILDGIDQCARPPVSRAIKRTWLTTDNWGKAQADAQGDHDSTEELLFGLETRLMPQDLRWSSGSLCNVDAALVSPPSEHPLFDGIVPWLIARDCDDLARRAKPEDQAKLERSIDRMKKLIHGRV